MSNLITKARSVTGFIVEKASACSLRLKQAVACALVAVAMVAASVPAHATYTPPTIESVIADSGVSELIGTAIIALAAVCGIVAVGYLAFLVFRVMLSWGGKALGK